MTGIGSSCFSSFSPLPPSLLVFPLAPHPTSLLLSLTYIAPHRNYGRLTDYFLPRRLSCIPPTDWADPKKSYPFHQGSHWSGRPRLRYSRVLLSNLDDWTREEYLSSSSSRAQLAALQKSDMEHAEREDRWILEEGGTLPQVFEEVFEDQAEVVKGLWRLKREVKGQVEEIKKRIGMHRERWEAGEDGGAGEEEKRGPVIACVSLPDLFLSFLSLPQVSVLTLCRSSHSLHVRLGDKASEYEHDSKEMGITNTLFVSSLSPPLSWPRTYLHSSLSQR
jgi:hypothetical protein